MVTEKKWTEFRNTGLILFVNQFLHIFGWAIIFELDEKQEVNRVYPARVKYRGFEHKDAGEAYQEITNYMAENSQELKKEIDEK